MKSFSEALMLELETQLEAIHTRHHDPLPHALEAVLVLVSFLEQLKLAFLKQKGLSKEDEIHFFKEIKPLFSSRLTYYSEIYRIESSRPFATAKGIRKYYREELGKLQLFVERHLDFYHYYRKGCTYLDDKYFLRGIPDLLLPLDSFRFQADPRFSTSHDYHVAQLMANNLLGPYLEARITAFEPYPTPLSATKARPLKWTGSKVGLVELAYALHSDGTFLNGTCDLKEIIAYFESIFEVDLGQYHRTFFEISARKTERTKFLNVLSDKLLKRMDDRDGL